MAEQIKKNITEERVTGEERAVPVYESGYLEGVFPMLGPAEQMIEAVKAWDRERALSVLDGLDDDGLALLMALEELGHEEAVAEDYPSMAERSRAGVTDMGRDTSIAQLLAREGLAGNLEAGLARAKEPRKKHGKAIAASIAAILVAGAIGIGAYVALQPQTPDGPSAAGTESKRVVEGEKKSAGKKVSSPDDKAKDVVEGVGGSDKATTSEERHDEGVAGGVSGGGSSASDPATPSGGASSGSSGGSQASTPGGSGSSSGSSGGGSTGGSSSGNSGSGATQPPSPVQPSEPVHSHDYVAVYGDPVWVVDQVGYSYEQGIYGHICNGCGADITGRITEHAKEAGRGSGCGGWHEGVIGYETVTIPEIGHWGDAPLLGHRCACGASR